MTKILKLVCFQKYIDTIAAIHEQFGVDSIFLQRLDMVLKISKYCSHNTQIVRLNIE